MTMTTVIPRLYKRHVRGCKTIGETLRGRQPTLQTKINKRDCELLQNDLCWFQEWKKKCQMTFSAEN